MIVSIANMKYNQTGVIVQVNAGYGLVHRLEAMGIRLGMKVTKRSAQLLRGPISVQIGQSELALGFGIAQRIMVEVM